MNEVKTTFGILPVFNSNNERVSGILSATSYDGASVFHMEMETDELMIVETGDFFFGGKNFNAHCGDSRYDYYFVIPKEILQLKQM